MNELRARAAGARPAAPAAAPQAAAAPVAPMGTGGAPSGPGWVIQMHGYHYHNKDLNNQGTVYVRDTLIKQLRDGKVTLPDKDGKPVEWEMKELGIGFPVLIRYTQLINESIPDPNAIVDKSKGAAEVPKIDLQRMDFTLQFAWQPTPLSKRLELREQKAKASQATQSESLAAQPSGGE